MMTGSAALTYSLIHHQRVSGNLNPCRPVKSGYCLALMMVFSEFGTNQVRQSEPPHHRAWVAIRLVSKRPSSLLLHRLYLPASIAQSESGNTLKAKITSLLILSQRLNCTGTKAVWNLLLSIAPHPASFPRQSTARSGSGATANLTLRLRHHH
jgi:hypothetical protein